MAEHGYRTWSNFFAEAFTCLLIVGLIFTIGFHAGYSLMGLEVKRIYVEKQTVEELDLSMFYEDRFQDRWRKGTR